MERLAAALVLALWATFATPVMADETCGPNAYVDSTRYTDEKEIVTCACDPGFNHTAAGCERAVPEMLLAHSTLFLPVGAIGTVTASVEHDGKRYDIPSSRIFYANVITTGQESLLTAYVTRDMRLRVAADTQLRLGDFVPDFALVIDDLKGMFRLDNHLTPKERRQAAELYGRAKAYLRKATTRDFRIRLLGGVIAVRGSDLLLEGRENGAIVVHVLSGLVTLENPDGQSVLNLHPGDSGLMPREGLPHMLGSNRQDATETLWRAHTRALSSVAWNE